MALVASTANKLAWIVTGPMSGFAMVSHYPKRLSLPSQRAAGPKYMAKVDGLTIYCYLNLTAYSSALP